MKIPQRTVTVTLTDPDGNDAVLVFDMLRENEKQRFFSALSALGKLMEEAKKHPEQADGRFDNLHFQAEIARHSQEILRKCLSVTNLTEADHEVTIEDVRSGNLYPETVEMIVEGFKQNRSRLGDTGAEEKNASLPPVPSADSASSS